MVVRHLIFFQFTEDTSKDRLKKFEEDIRELQSKISEYVKGIQMGWRSPTEDAPYQLCFVMDFDKIADVENYGPHPAHVSFVEGGKENFVKIFGADFVGIPYERKSSAGEFKHVTFLSPKEGIAEEEVRKCAADDEGLAKHAVHVEFGKNVMTPERADGRTHCLLVTFGSQTAFDEWKSSDERKAHEQRLAGLTIASRIVVDFAVDISQ